MRHRIEALSTPAEAGDAARPDVGKVPHMLLMPNPVSSLPDESALPVLTDRVRPERIAAGWRAPFECEIAPAQVIPYRDGEVPIPTQTEGRQDKESMQFPADEVGEPLFTLMPCAETPDAVPPDALLPDALPPDALPEAAASTQTGRTQDKESVQLPVQDVEEPVLTPTARGDRLDALVARAEAKRGIAVDPAAVCDGTRAEDPQATQTGRRQNEKKPSVLTDEVKAFIVGRLAHYETPTRIAAAVKLEFGIEITRRQAFAYDPAGSRPPAQRWIDLHAATRAKFLRDVAEIGIAQQVVRLQMLDRFAREADDDNRMERAAKFLVLAAKECGGFYERKQRPKAGAAPSH
jgi:hypothetical protein